MWGVRGRALSHPRLPALWAGCRGPLPTHWLWVRGDAGVGTRHQPHRARSCELALRAVGAARGRPGGAPPAWVWGVRGRALSHPRLPALWAGCRGPLPTGSGCGGVRAWGPVTNPTARWLAAGRHEGAQGGRLLPGCGASGLGRSPTPACPPSGRAAGAHYPLAVGAGGCGRGDPSPTPQRALLRAGFARCGGSTRATGGGASCLAVGRPGSGALPPPTARPLGGLPGPTAQRRWVRGGAGVGTRHQPHSALSCMLWGRHEGARGGRLLPECGAAGVGRSPTPDCPPSGRAAGAHYPLAVGAGGCGRGDPSPTPQPALLRAGFARCGGGTRAPRGGASCLGVGRPGSGALQPPTARPLGELPGPTTQWLWVWGGAGVGTRHQPHSALALCAVGAARGRPGGAPRAWVWGVRGRALSHPRLPALWAGCRGPLPTGCGCGGVWAWGPVTNPTARALACWLCALWGRHEGARGGRLLPGCGASGVGRSPTPNCPPSGRAAGAHYPLAVGVGGCGRGDPSPTPQCALLRAVGAACGCPGGAPLAWVWGVRGRALSHPRLPALWAGCRGPLPTGCGCGGVRAWGPVTNPTARALACWLCALWGRHEGARGGRLVLGCGASGVERSPTPDCLPSGRAAGAHYPLAVGVGGCGSGDPSPTPQRDGFARCGGGMWVPWGGASCLGVRRPGSGALPPPTARPLGGLPGPTTHWLWVRGGAGVGTRHQPHSACSCVLALRAVGAARGRPGGAPPAWVWGVRGRALSHPRLPALWAGCRGPLPTGCGCGGVRAWGPVTNPTARWLCALWGRHEGARGGRLLPGCGASGVGRSRIPDCPPSGRAAGARYPLAVGAGGCGRGDPSPTPQLALLRAGFARCGGGTRAPGGGACCLGVGRPGSGALPPPTARTLGGLPGPTTQWLWVRGGAGVGTRHQPHSARSCVLALRAVGAARGCPGRAPLAWVWGVRGRALSHPRLPALWAGCRGPLPNGCGCGGVRAWGPVTNPTARCLCALWGRHEGSREGRLLPGCEASGVGRSPTPNCPPSGQAAGAHYPLAVGAGGCGRGDPSPTRYKAKLHVIMTMPHSFVF